MREFWLKKDHILWLELVLLALLCGTQLLGLALPSLVLTAGVGCLMLSIDRIETSTIALFAAMPMFNLFNGGIGSTSMFYLFVFIFWYKYGKYHHWKMSPIKLLVLLAFVLLRLTSGDLESTAKGAVLFSVLVLTYQEDFFDSRLGKLVFWITLTFLLASLVGYLMLITGRSIYMRGLVYSQGVNTVRFAGLVGDSVFYAQFGTLLISANLVLGAYRRKYRGLSMVFTALLTLFCLLTYAKTGVLLVAGTLVVYVVWLIYVLARRWTTLPHVLLVLVVCILGVIALAAYLLSGAGDVGTLVENYLTRFRSSDLLTGRLKIWSHYVGLLMGRWPTLICAMPQWMYDMGLTISTGRGLNTAHNIYIETACAFGLLATEAVLIWLGGKCLRFLQRGKQHLAILPMGVILASGVVLHGHFEFHYYFLVAIALGFLNWDLRRDRFALS